MKAFNIWVTQKCNLECKYCYEGTEKGNGELTIEQIPSIIIFIRQMSENEEYISVNFHGGEPLLNVDAIFEICNQLEDLDKLIYYSLTTNALLLKKSLLVQLKRYNISLSVSLDGVEECHNQNRVDAMQKGSYEKSMKGALLALEMGMDIGVRMTVTPNNYWGMTDGVRHLIACGFQTIVAVPDYFCQGWTEGMIESIGKQMLLLEEYRGKFYFLEKQLSCRNVCSGGEKECNIDVDLVVYPCTYSVGLVEYKIGTVTTGINREKRKQIEEIGKTKNANCVGCGLEVCCMSTRCKILNKILMGNYYKASPVVCAFERLAYTTYH